MKKLAIITAVLIVFLGACTDSTRVQNIRLPKKPAIVGLAGPVMLSPDTTEIILRDYFPMKQTFDSLSVSEELSVSFSKDSSRIILNPKSENLPKLSVLQFFTQSGKQSILLKKQGMVKHLLTFNPEDKVYKQVQMKGEMNAWNPESTPLLLQGGIWNVEVSVEPGNYQYIFVADGEEILDPSNPDSVSNGMGGYNSVLKLAKDNSQKPILETKVYDKHSITFECKNSAEEVFVFFDNFLMPDEAVKQTGNEYTCAFPTNSDYRKRVHIRVFAYNSTGFSNDLLIPLHKGSVLADANSLNRTDFHATVLYN
ncbi:MAG: hypothetical protein U9N85_13145, partial [Bacteroidota bacterium]|nr:hypothetical protein [Bacteroidota bacterium]